MLGPEALGACHRRRPVGFGRGDLGRAAQCPCAFGAVRGRAQAEGAERSDQDRVVTGVEVGPARGHGRGRPLGLAFVDRELGGDQRDVRPDVGVDLAHRQALRGRQQRMRDGSPRHGP